jgi:hypothetical protein
MEKGKDGVESEWRVGMGLEVVGLELLVKVLSQNLLTGTGALQLCNVH